MSKQMVNITDRLAALMPHKGKCGKCRRVQTFQHYQHVYAAMSFIVASIFL